MTAQSPGALVLLSGGQDSTVCLAWALDRYERVETVGFAYGQRHSAELGVRGIIRAKLAAMNPLWRERLGSDHMLELKELGRLSDTALTREAEIELDEAGLPSTFVPGRNLLFFTYAAAVAYRRGVRTLVGGMCETDYSGYPDCRDDTLKALQVALGLGMGRRFVIEPLLELIVEHTHSCYLGDRSRRHAWGYGCGGCPACELRGKGWERYRASS